MQTKGKAINVNIKFGFRNHIVVSSNLSFRLISPKGSQVEQKVPGEKLSHFIISLHSTDVILIEVWDSLRKFNFDMYQLFLKRYKTRICRNNVLLQYSPSWVRQIYCPNCKSLLLDQIDISIQNLQIKALGRRKKKWKPIIQIEPYFSKPKSTYIFVKLHNHSFVMTLPGKLGSWFSVCNLILTDKKKYEEY